MQIFKKSLFVLIFLVAIASSLPFSSYVPDPSMPSEADRAAREQEIQQLVLRQVRDFRRYVKDSLQAETLKEDCRQHVLQERFLKARLLYKKFEWAAEYFIGPLAQRLNGAPVQEIENADLLDPTMAYAINATGLQVIEEYVFPEYDESNRESLQEGVAQLEEDAGYLVSYFEDHQLADWRILDAAKLEIFRIITLGITGFDNPLTLHSLEESASSLQSLHQVLTRYTVEKNSSLLKTITDAITYLNHASDFDSFDRATFITTYANKISTEIALLTNNFSADRKHYNRLLNQEARTLFDDDAFNVNAFTPGNAYHLSPAKIELGEALFYDPQLSGDGSRSCATCHQADRSFTDGLATNTHIYHTEKHLPRNTPTLLNAALQSNYFYDMRALTLEDQTLDVIQNEEEMDGNIQEISAYLNKNTRYQNLFEEAFPDGVGNDVQPFQIANALASYVRSLTKLNSRFDQYMRGQKQALSDDEIKGFNLFMGKAKCATCHFLPLFNGTTPPKYMASEAEVIGVPQSLTDSIIDPDKGWYDIIGVASYAHAFKTPTVRNIEQTAPYMHNGIYNTLEEVMEFYNNAGSVGLGFELDNVTLPEDSLNLSDSEIDQIVMFMKTLEDI